MSAPETIYTRETKIICDGGGGVLGHPRIYLTFPQNTSLFESDNQKMTAIDCPYCGRHYEQILSK